jgi:hypothetical protein
MTNKNSLHNVVALDQFSALTEDEMMMVEGGGGIEIITFAYGVGYVIGKTIYHITH